MVTSETPTTPRRLFMRFDRWTLAALLAVAAVLAIAATVVYYPRLTGQPTPIVSANIATVLEPGPLTAKQAEDALERVYGGELVTGVGDNVLVFSAKGVTQDDARKVAAQLMYQAERDLQWMTGNEHPLRCDRPRTEDGRLNCTVRFKKEGP